MQISKPVDSNWYFDTGATHHMTADAGAMHTRSPHVGPDRVMLGNGDSIPVTQTGNISILLGSTHCQLKDAFHVPAMHKNLLSVAKLTRDNFVRICFDPFWYSVHDHQTGRPLFRGSCRDGLYPISLPSPPYALSATRVSSQLWHNRLGHPSIKVLSFLGSHDMLDTHFKKVRTRFCHGCALGKSTRLPFADSTHRASAPFELIHSDVLMSLLFGTQVLCFLQ